MKRLWQFAFLLGLAFFLGTLLPQTSSAEPYEGCYCTNNNCVELDGGDKCEERAGECGVDCAPTRQNSRSFCGIQLCGARCVNDTTCSSGFCSGEDCERRNSSFLCGDKGCAANQKAVEEIWCGPLGNETLCTVVCKWDANCGSSVTCPDGECTSGEECSCPADCDSNLCVIPPTCGDGNESCDVGENCDNCEEDCGECDVVECGNGSCSETEDCVSCPVDCGGVCKVGTVQGLYFDADAGGVCGSPATKQPRIPGVSVSIEELISYPEGVCNTEASGTTGGDGIFLDDEMCPGTYRVFATSAVGYLVDPLYTCGGVSQVVIEGNDTKTLSFGLTHIKESWFQVEGSGNVFSGGNIISEIPSTCVGECDNKFVSTSGEDPGLVVYEGSTNLEMTSVSEKGWLANSTYDGSRYNYDLLYNQLGFSDSSVPDYSGAAALDVAKPTQAPNSGTAYFVDGDMIINSSVWDVASGENIVFLVNGNLTIRNKVWVTDGGFVAFIVKGNIDIAQIVNSNDGQGAVEGIYVADGSINTGNGANRLILEGSFISWTGINLVRDLGENNDILPAELFRYRSDLIDLLPSFMKRPRFTWREVAP